MQHRYDLKRVEKVDSMCLDETLRFRPNNREQNRHFERMYCSSESRFRRYCDLKALSVSVTQ